MRRGLSLEVWGGTSINVGYAMCSLKLAMLSSGFAELGRIFRWSCYYALLQSDSFFQPPPTGVMCFCLLKYSSCRCVYCFNQHYNFAVLP